MLQVRDEYAYSHAVRVNDYAGAIAQQMGLPEPDIEELSAAAMLHNLGEVKQRSSAGGRSPSDAPMMFAQAHAETEARLLAAIPELANVSDVVRFHRENFDGSGSPTGLAAEQIPLLSRILRVAVEYGLMIQPKPPAASMRHEEAMRFLSQRSGKQFDPQIIEIMSQLSHSELPNASSGSSKSPGPFAEKIVVDSAYPA
jgi:HD-GYP domain-containing protein (c-di-GMP phosphodiesterase class II)